MIKPPKQGDYTDELYQDVKELVDKINALDNLQVRGTNFTGKLTYVKGQYILEIVYNG